MVDHGGSQTDGPSASTFSCVGADPDLEVRGMESEGVVKQARQGLEGPGEEGVPTTDRLTKAGRDGRGARS